MLFIIVVPVSIYSLINVVVVVGQWLNHVPMTRSSSVQVPGDMKFMSDMKSRLKKPTLTMEGQEELPTFRLCT